MDFHPTAARAGQMTNIPINADRLWASLMDMAKIGATEKGGNCRLTLTDVDKEK